MKGRPPASNTAPTVCAADVLNSTTGSRPVSVRVCTEMPMIGRATSIHSQARVQDVPRPFAKEVDGKHEQDDGEARES